MHINIGSSLTYLKTELCSKSQEDTSGLRLECSHWSRSRRLRRRSTLGKDEIIVDAHAFQHVPSSDDSFNPHVGYMRYQLFFQTVFGYSAGVFLDESSQLRRQLDLREDRLLAHERIPQRKQVLFL